MKRRKLKSFVVPVMYVFSIAMLLGSIYCVERIVNHQFFQKRDVDVVEEVNQEDDVNYSNEVPTINTEPRKIGRASCRERV